LINFPSGIQKEEAFIKTWMCREAFLKANGFGLSQDFRLARNKPGYELPFPSVDNTIMFTNPSTHSLAGVPTGIVPDHGLNRLAQFLDFLAAPLQELNGNAAHRSSIHETQNNFHITE